MTGWNHDSAEERKSDLASVSMATEEEVEAVAAEEVDDVGMVTDADAWARGIDIGECPFGVRIASIDLVDPDERGWQNNRFIDQEPHAPRLHRTHHLLRSRPVIVITQDRENTVARRQSALP